MGRKEHSTTGTPSWTVESSSWWRVSYLKNEIILNLTDRIPAPQRTPPCLFLLHSPQYKLYNCSYWHHSHISRLKILIYIEYSDILFVLQAGMGTRSEFIPSALTCNTVIFKNTRSRRILSVVFFSCTYEKTTTLYVQDNTGEKCRLLLT